MANELVKLAVVPFVKWSEARMATETLADRYRITFTVPWEPRIVAFRTQQDRG